MLDLDNTLVKSFGKLDKKLEKSPSSDVYVDGYQLFNDPQYYDIRRRSFTIDITDCVSTHGEGNMYEHLRYWVIRRPGCERLLRFCSNVYREVIVWSAGLPSYVNAITRELFKDIHGTSPRGTPSMVLTRDDVTITQEANSHGPGAVSTIRKPITTILKQRPDLSEADILIIDDRLDTMVFNESNGIVVPQYNPRTLSECDSTADIALYRLMLYLSRPEVIEAYDVRLLRKDNIF